MVFKSKVTAPKKLAFVLLLLSFFVFLVFFCIFFAFVCVCVFFLCVVFCDFVVCFWCFFGLFVKVKTKKSFFVVYIEFCWLGFLCF